MGTCTFVLDLVVSKFVMPGLKIEDPEKFEVRVQFNRTTVCLRKSRINVSDFKEGSGTEFQMSPTKLCEVLGTYGMPFAVKYNGFISGTGQMSFPQHITERINEDMNDLIHVETCPIQQFDENVGMLELLCRLIIKCDDNPMSQDIDFQCNVDKIINQKDIMFILSEPQKCSIPCDPCSETWEPEVGDDFLKLDLERYRSRDASGLEHEEIFKHSPMGVSVCSELRKITLEYEQIIDSILKSTGLPQSLKPPCRITNELSSSHDVVCNYTLPEIAHSSLSVPQPETTDFCRPKLSALINNGENTEIRPIRFCPICLNSMSWLPKFATCPMCGVRPVPVVEESYNQKELTAEQILNDFLGKPPAVCDEICGDACAKTSKDKMSQKKQARYQCACKEKLSAHCADIFQGDDKQVPKLSDVESNSSDAIFVDDAKEEDNRPHLARVFSDLRDMYEKKNVKGHTKFQQCEKKYKLNLDAAGLSRNQRSIKSSKREKLNSQIIDNNNENRHFKKKCWKARHKSCENRQRPVSRRHGWAWSSSQEARKYGWRPGAILKPIKRLMNFFLYYLPAQYACSLVEAEDKPKRTLPTLNVCKNNRELIITWRALNNQHVAMRPIVFKIVKGECAVALSEIKRKLKARGFRKCTCHNTVMMCICRSTLEKKQLEFAMQKECKRRGMENCVDHLVLTDTSDSEVEFDFDVTPPGAVAKPQSLLKPLTLNQATQSSKKHINVPSAYPIKHSSYWRTYDCAAGDRYTGTALGAPGEEVFEDGVFGFRGGGPHGASATPGGIPKSKGIWGASSGGPMHGGGRGGPGSIGGMTFPGDKPKSDVKGGRCQPIPVKNLKRFEKMAAMAAQVKQAAIEKENEKRKLGINMMKYLKKQGVFSTKKPHVGKDGLTDAQRRRRAQHQVPPFSIAPMSRSGAYYNPFAPQCYNPNDDHQCCSSYVNQCYNLNIDQCYYRQPQQCCYPCHCYC